MVRTFYVESRIYGEFQFWAYKTIIENIILAKKSLNLLIILPYDFDLNFKLKLYHFLGI